MSQKNLQDLNSSSTKETSSSSTVTNEIPTTVVSDNSNVTTPSKICNETNNVCFKDEKKNFKGFISDTPTLLIQSMFSIKRPNFTNENFSTPIFQTERLQATGIGSKDYSPMYYFQQTVPVGVYAVDYDKKSVDYTIPALTYRSVRQNYDFSISSSYPAPVLTDFGRQIWQLIQNDISTPGSIRSLLPIKTLRDQRSLATLLAQNTSQLSSVFDEAPVLRCLLMMSIFQRDNLRFSSYNVNTLFPNCVGKFEKSHWSSQPPAVFDVNRPVQIPQGADTSKIVAYSLYRYTSILATEVIDTFIDSNTVVIPVKQVYSGMNFLMPYIMSFTTTQWWAGCAVAKYYVYDLNGNQLDGSPYIHSVIEASLTHVPGNYSKIALIIIDSYDDIPLDFIIPVVGEQQIVLQNNQSNNNFADYVYSWMDRTQWTEIPDRTQPLTEALARMQETVALPGVIERVKTIASELSHTKPHTSFVWCGGNVKPELKVTVNQKDQTGPASQEIIDTTKPTVSASVANIAVQQKAKIGPWITETSEKEAWTDVPKNLSDDIAAFFYGKTVTKEQAQMINENIGMLKDQFKAILDKSLAGEKAYVIKTVPHVYTHALSFNRTDDATPFRFGDYKLDDIRSTPKTEKEYKDGVRTLLTLNGLLRITPCHLFPQSMFTNAIKTGNGFELSKFSSNYTQYNIANCTPVTRILIASGIWSTIPFSLQSLYKFMDVYTLENLQVSSVLAVLIEWLFSSLGINIFSINGCDGLQRCWPSIMKNILPVVSANFIVNTLPLQCFFDKPIAVLDNFNILEHYQKKFPGIVGFYDLKGGALPFWFVNAYIQKLSGNPLYIQSDPSFITEAALSKGKYAFRFTSDSLWSDPCLTTISVDYQADGYFLIRQSTLDNTLVPIVTSFDVYSHMDALRYCQAEFTPTSTFLPSSVSSETLIAVELDTIIYPGMVSTFNPCFLDVTAQGNPNIFALSKNSNRANCAYLLVSQLQFPDPFLDWLTRVAPELFDRLASGNPVGAISLLIKESAEPVADWVVNSAYPKVRGLINQLFRDDDTAAP